MEIVKRQYKNMVLSHVADITMKKCAILCINKDITIYIVKKKLKKGKVKKRYDVRIKSRDNIYAYSRHMYESIGDMRFIFESKHDEEIDG